MTENKRFLLNDKRLIEDNHLQIVLDGGEDCIDMVELLNELNDENEQLKRQISNLEHTRDFVGDVCADCNRLENEVDELKSELESAMGEINHCHLIIATLVENEGVNDYFDLLNKCDNELLKEMGWE